MISPLTSSPEDRAGAVLTVDLAALVENWRRLKRKVGPACDMGAVVKADAYGLGLAPVARGPAGRPGAPARSTWRTWTKP